MLYMKCGGYVGNIFVLMAKYGIEERNTKITLCENL